jgi:hypothetical protein
MRMITVASIYAIDLQSAKLSTAGQNLERCGTLKGERS